MDSQFIRTFYLTNQEYITTKQEVY